VTADSVRLTGLVGLIDKGDLGGKSPGFILLAPEGRYSSHFYPGFDSNALGWDNWYRQLRPAGDVTIAGTVYHENVDAAAIDHFVQELLSTRNVNRRRIYSMGWSNGAAMALLYALNRPWIAAAAVYSAPDPFAALFDVCTQIPVTVTPAGDGQAQIFNPHVPLMHVRNSCDIGGICPNGSRFATRMRALGNILDDVILDPSGRRVTSCDDTCGTDEMADGRIGRGASLRGLVNHMRWPSMSTPERKYISGRSKNVSVGGGRESWFGFWQGELAGETPPRCCSEYLVSSSSDRSSLIQVLAAVDRH